MSPSSVALIVSTHNQPGYLARVLRAVDRQTSMPREVILADDGSGQDTGTLFTQWGKTRPGLAAHTWQEHKGFRKARILNLAIARATADYVVFLDGDTVPHPCFVADHRKAAAAGFFVQGHRALIEQRAAEWFGLGEMSADRRRALFSGQIRGLKHAYRWPFPLARARQDLRGIRGCNLAVWRRDLVEVNGYNEAFVGWGREDSEMVVRLMHLGRSRLDLRGRALCYHLWHPPAPRNRLDENDRLLREAEASKSTRCAQGLDRHLPAA